MSTDDMSTTVPVPIAAALQRQPRGAPSEADARCPRILSRATAHRTGLDDQAIKWRLRSRRWIRLAPGVYSSSPPADFTDLCQAANLHGGAGAVVTAAAALRLYGVLREDPEIIRVLLPIDGGARSFGSIIVPPTPIPAVPVRQGRVIVAAAARAVSDHVHDLRRQSDAMAIVTSTLQRGLCTLDQLQAELRRGAQRGSKLLRIALEDAGHGAHSHPEARAGRLLREAGVSGFGHNVAVGVAAMTFYGDLVWPELKAILEIDSVEHHFHPADQDRTLRRDHLLQTHGWVVLHVTPSQLRDGAAFVLLVRHWLGALSARGTPS